MTTAIRVSAPASIGNLGVGFDVLGACLDTPRDEVIARISENAGVRIATIRGDGGRLPLEADRNTAGRAAGAVLDHAAAGLGLELEITKGVPAAGGLGSSAASAVAAAVAADAALATGLDRDTLLACALEGEKIASGALHGDNVAPCLLGGIVLVRSVDPVDIVELPVPDDLAVALLHPPIEVATRDARAALPARIPLTDAVGQWADLAAFVAALYRADWELLGRSLRDRVVEPHRARLVPGFTAVQAAAMEAGALGCSLSGAGPSIFAVCRGARAANDLSRVMADALRAATGLEGTAFGSPIARDGARIEDGV